jgi:photosynthetic reaction center cytochrome c subunit
MRLRTKIFRLLLFVSAIGFGFFSTLSLRLRAAQEPSSQRSMAAEPDMSKPAEEVYKNIQVLKGVPASQIIPAMEFITSSLGVGCEHCHVRGKFDADDKKPKKIARLMMKMMFAINQNNFDGHRQITCYSCHRGALKPVSIPLIAGAAAPVNPKEAEQGQPAPALALPPAQVLVEKYVNALGGAAAITNITSLSERGTATFNGRDVAIEIYAKTPNKRLSVMKVGPMENVTVYNGSEGWMSVPRRGVRQMYGGDLAAAKMDADLHFAVDLSSMFQTLNTSGIEQIAGKDAYLVVGETQGQPPVELYFDKVSGMLVRIVRYADSPLGLNPTQIDYNDFRNVNGVKMPFQWTTARPEGQFTIRIESAQANIPIEDSKFEKPEPPPPPSM